MTTARERTDYAALLTETIGRDATMILAKAVGGTRIYLPERFTEDHWLSEIIGLENARKLQSRCRMEQFYMPRLQAPEVRARNCVIVERRRAGLLRRDIALEFGLSERQVDFILRANGATNIGVDCQRRRRPTKAAAREDKK